MRFGISETYIEHKLSTESHIVIRYKVAGRTNSLMRVKRTVYEALASKVARYVASHHGIIDSIRQMAREMTEGGCPCNLADCLGFRDVNELYAIFRVWDGEFLLEREGNARIFGIPQGEKFETTRRAFINMAMEVQIGEAFSTHRKAA